MKSSNFKKCRAGRGRRVFSLLCALGILLLFGTTAFTAQACAADDVKTQGDLQYRILQDRTAEITGYTGKSEIDLVIPEIIAGAKVTSIGAGAFNQAFLNSIKLPGTIKTIGSQAFAFNNITEMVIPEGVKTIGVGLFNFCTDLESVSFPGSLKSVGDAVFANCIELKTVKISEDHPLLEITGGGLYNKADQKLICFIADSEKDLFVIPEGTKAIGSYAFPSSVFPTAVEIPASVTEIKEDSITGGSSLEAIRVSPENQNYESVDGVLFNRVTHALIHYPANRAATVYAVPDGTAKIGRYAFLYCRNLQTVTVPGSVKAVEENAFNSCHSLSSVELQEGVKSIGKSAFSSCRNLSSVTVPDSVTKIGEDAFGSTLFSSFLMAQGLGVQTTVITNEGSYAEQWCKENGVKYSSTPDGVNNSGADDANTTGGETTKSGTLGKIGRNLLLLGVLIAYYVFKRTLKNFIRQPENNGTAKISDYPETPYSEYDKAGRLKQLEEWRKSGLIDRDEYIELKKRYSRPENDL